MTQAITKYFALNQTLSLPGIGSFLVETEPVQIDFANKSILPSKNKIIFTNDKIQPGKDFFVFLSEELHVDEKQAENKFAAYTSLLQNELSETHKLYFKGIGNLTKHSGGTSNFQPEDEIHFSPVLTAERVIRKNASHKVIVGEHERTSEEMHTALHGDKKVKKERWWIAATVLALIGIAAIIFYYTTPM